jgi:hypothetical protein
VDFENYEEAAKAMREKDHKVFNEKFGDRYVRLIQVRLGPRTPCMCTVFFPVTLWVFVHVLLVVHAQFSDLQGVFANERYLRG